MNFDKLSSAFSRLLFFAAFALLVLAIVEKIANLSGYTIMRAYNPQRLLELAATMIVFVIALLLRQVREELKKPGA